MELNDIMEKLRDVELGKRHGMGRELAREAREALMMLAERPLGKAGGGKTPRYSAETYAGALLALGDLQKEAERPEEKAEVSFILEAVAEMAEREHPESFRQADREC